ncbi:MAG: efflux RND transporter permease subunit, partial [Planctomycetaceae bacterium]
MAGSDRDEAGEKTAETGGEALTAGEFSSLISHLSSSPGVHKASDPSTPITDGNGRHDIPAHPAAPREDDEPRGVVTSLLDAVGRGTVGAIVGVNRWVQAGRIRSLAVVVLFVGASCGLSWAFWPPVEYLPEGNRNFVFTRVSPPPGYNLDRLEQMGREVEADLKPYWDVDPGSPEAEKLEYPVINYYFFVVRGREVFMGFRSDDPERVDELVPLLREVSGQFPGTMSVTRQSSLFERGSSGGRQIDVEITGPELERLVELGAQVMADVRETMPRAQAMPSPSLDLSNPEVHLQPKRVESAEAGVAAGELGYVVDALIDGAYAGDYYSGGDKIDMTILGRQRFERNSQNLAYLP